MVAIPDTCQSPNAVLTSRPAEWRDVINKVGQENVGAVEVAGTDVVFPACVRIRNGAKVLGARSSGRCRINRTGIGVTGTQVEVLELRLDLRLQSVVMGIGFIRR